NTSTVVFGATYLPMPAPTSSEKSSVSRLLSLWFAPIQGAKYQRPSQSPACALEAAPNARAITAYNLLLFIGVSCVLATRELGSPPRMPRSDPTACQHA